MQNLFRLLLILSLSAFCFQNNKVTVSTNAQTTEDSNLTTKSKDKIILNQATIEGSFQLLVMYDAELETVLTHPLPEIRFIFPCQNAKVNKKNCNEGFFNAKLPLNQSDLEKFWKDILTIRYQIEKNDLNGNNYYQSLNSIFIKSSDFSKLLQKSNIETPTGERKISENEADEVVRYINICSTKVIENIKKVES